MEPRPLLLDPVRLSAPAPDLVGLVEAPPVRRCILGRLLDVEGRAPVGAAPEAAGSVLLGPAVEPPAGV